DLVLIAGDVFHTVRPTNPAILHAFLQFQRLREMLPEAGIVMIAGNHDTPRTRDTGCILRLFSQLGISVVDGDPEWVGFDELDVRILAVPDMAQGKPRLEPDPTARYNILLLHGEIEGVLPDYGRELDRSPMEITLEELGAHKWDYVALGHYHVYRAVAQNAFYSGSLDYTSTNPWGELAEERDAGIDEKIVRLVVRDVPRHILRELDHKALRDYKRRALHFHLDTRRPEIVRPEKGEGGPGRRASLADTVRDKLRSRPLTENIDREALVELGLHYLREADLVAGPTGEESVA